MIGPFSDINENLVDYNKDIIDYNKFKRYLEVKLNNCLIIQTKFFLLNFNFFLLKLRFFKTFKF